MSSSTVKYSIVVVSLLAMSACGAFRDRSHDYRRAELSKPLELPPGVESDALGDRYVVPGIESHTVLPGEFSLPRPEPLTKNVGTAEVKIQKLDDQRWILLDGTPNQVWPRVRAFLDRAGLKLGDIDGEQGIMETEWRETEPGAPLERFRFVLDQGVQVGTSEIHVLVQNRPGEDFPEVSTDLQREDQMVRVLAQYLADSEAQGTVSILARRGGSESKGKIFLEGEEGNHYLRLFLPNERAWAALGLALTKAGFEIEDASPAVNKYWLSYIDPEEELGWFSRMIGADRRKRSRYVVEMKMLGEFESVILLNYQKGRRLRNDEREALLKRIMGFLH
ncbi:MAG: outer membrane protein assembly factor BamC [Spongiibacter sp.]|uniref:Outer membrane protein assembly factor BamC n=1 Tax=Spongiibacter thalassae TaxID=2721624 RepID=A0ABX1GFS5_9GAMM|nr:outer membrane protein assembly factor BamC [Spongiibacter thalassae]MDX1506502.1 outer membrane protein assembly factor BamC [Spongiibacter sp.]NKI17790.1 outer membrane protein assembly factor BamC [Spongiibacter thalassae]